MRQTATILAAAVAAAFTGSSAIGQDLLSQARASYSSLSGEWAAPGLTCADPANTWRFGMEGVRAGTSLFDLVGIGGGPGSVRLDLVDRRNGQRMPLALIRSGDGLSVNGSGISTILVPCRGSENDLFARVEPPSAIRTMPLDGSPTTEELRGALETSRNAPVTDPFPENIDDGAAAEASFFSELTGAWSGSSGVCDWRLGENRISAQGEGYEVVNFSGTPDRIGIQAMRDDGTPATFTVTRTGPASANVRGSVVGGADLQATLSRC